MKIYLVFGVEADQNDDDPLGLVTTSLISYYLLVPSLNWREVASSCANDLYWDWLLRALFLIIRWFPLLTGGNLLVLALMICIYAIPSSNHRSWTNEYV